MAAHTNRPAIQNRRGTHGSGDAFPLLSPLMKLRRAAKHGFQRSCRVRAHQRANVDSVLRYRLHATIAVIEEIQISAWRSMPLAIMRRQVKDLPFHFSLSDAQAMSPEMKLSNFSDVVVIARISKSGGATPQSGDLQGVRDAVKVGTAKLEIVIDSVVP